MSKQPYTEVVEPEQYDGESLHPHEDDVVAVEQAPRRKWYFGDGMGKRILGVLVAVLVLGLLWYAYQRHLAQANDGAVQAEDPVPRVIPESSSTNTAPPPRRAVVPAAQPDTTTMASAATPAAIPATDSISPNPTNGMTFAGTGKFQVYRQGNLTWRVNTESGSTCIVFATMEEWQKPIVYQHGCATN